MITVVESCRKVVKIGYRAFETVPETCLRARSSRERAKRFIQLAAPHLAMILTSWDDNSVRSAVLYRELAREVCAKFLSYHHANTNGCAAAHNGDRAGSEIETFFSKLKKRKWPSLDLIRFASFSWSVYTKSSFSGRRLSRCSWFQCRNSFRMSDFWCLKKFSLVFSPSNLDFSDHHSNTSQNPFHELITDECLMRLEIFASNSEQKIPPPSLRPVCSSTFSRLEMKSDTFSFTQHISIRNWMISLDTMENRKRLRYQKDVSSGTDGVCIVASDVVAAGNPWNWVFACSAAKKESVSTTTNGNKANAVIKIFLAVSFFADAIPLSYPNNNSWRARLQLSFPAPANRAWKKIFHFFSKSSCCVHKRRRAIEEMQRMHFTVIFPTFSSNFALNMDFCERLEKSRHIQSRFRISHEKALRTTRAESVRDN